MMNERSNKERSERALEEAMKDADFAAALGALHTGTPLPGKMRGAPGSFTLEVTDSGYIICDATGEAVVCTAPAPYFCWCTEGTTSGNALVSIGNPIAPGDVNKRSERFLSVLQSFGGTIRTLRKSFVVSVPQNYTKVEGMVTIAYLGNTQPVQQTQQSLATRPGAKSFPFASLIEKPRVCHGVFGDSSTFEGVNTLGGDFVIEQFSFSSRQFYENVTPLYPAPNSIVDAQHLAAPHWYIAVGGATPAAPLYVTCRTTYEIIPLAGVSVVEGDLRVSNEADLRTAALTLGQVGPFPEPAEDIVNVGGLEESDDDSSSDDEEFVKIAKPGLTQEKTKKVAAKLALARAERRRARPVPVVNYKREPSKLRELGNGLVEKYYGLGKKPDGWWETFMSNSGRGVRTLWNTLFDIADLGEAVVDDPEVQQIAEKATAAALV